MGEHEITKPKIETKVVAATGGSIAGSSVALLSLTEGLPEWAKIVVILIGPPLMAFVSGYLAKHTPRTTA